MGRIKHRAYGTKEPFHLFNFMSYPPLGSNMELVLSSHPPPTVATIVPWIPAYGWVEIGVVASGLCLLMISLLYYMKGCGRFCARAAQTHQRGQRGCSSSSRPLPIARFPMEETDLATFVTRRTSIWRRHQLAGSDVFLMLD